MNDYNMFDENKLRENLAGLVQSLHTLLEGNITLQSLESALDSHDALINQFASLGVASTATEALGRIECFIIEHAPAIYAAQSTPQQQEIIIKRFARHLLAIEGIGPATAKQLFEARIALPEQLFGLTPEEVAALPLPPASLARVTALHTQQTTRQ
ncbi:helix-hairpin-helix domain-containing protein [Vreelandella olivaria]|uniref:helix-hairpin-helix domain-containing protein n=1 Tax=Vreelandella olivaria TaxID=390919 RepID=UPI00201F6B12|nr:helix-hairpin-helix domain-containing protein [Halomonas olivaria]